MVTAATPGPPLRQARGGVVYDIAMAQPEYLICMECETPVYVFEWVSGRVIEATCPMCGNDDPAAFASEEELEEMVAIDEEGGDDE